MQPLAYLAVRCCISWLQFLEGTNRAFICNKSILLTTGPVHCWSVVYALFIAVHLRTYRHIGHSQYEEQLPLWVWWIETLTVFSTVVWWIASCLLAFVRVVSDDMFGLPTSRYDVYTPKMLRFVLSRNFREHVSTAHMCSGIGLFLSLLFLACALPCIPGDFATSEVCLVFISFVYALVLLVMALRSTVAAGLKGPVEAGLLAVAEEAAAFGPQLCVMLTLANVPGHASGFERAIYLATTGSWGAAVAACGWKPVKCAGMAMPPSAADIAVCVGVNMAAWLTLVFCFPPLNTWPMWLLGLLLLLLACLFYLPTVRAPLIEILEPIMPIRNDVGVRLSAPARDGLRGLSRGLVMLCSLVIVWDVGSHVYAQPAPRAEPASYDYSADIRDDDYSNHLEEEDLYPDKWSAESRLLLRWKDSVEFVGEGRSLDLAAEALNLARDKLVSENVFPELRILLFRFLGPIERNYPHVSVSEKWEEFLSNPHGELGTLVDQKFPPYLDAGLCLSLPYQQEAQNSEHSHIHYILKSIDDADSRLAYAKVCSSWRHSAFPDEDPHVGEYDGPGFDGYDEDMEDHMQQHMQHWEDASVGEEGTDTQGPDAEHPPSADAVQEAPPS